MKPAKSAVESSPNAAAIAETPEENAHASSDSTRRADRWRRRATTRALHSPLPCPGARVRGACAHAMCCPIPCVDCWITADTQLNYVVMHRENDRIDLIPNIRFAGVSEDFTLLVPTPTLPSFSLAPARIWDEAAQLTAPVDRARHAMIRSAAETTITLATDDESARLE